MLDVKQALLLLLCILFLGDHQRANAGVAAPEELEHDIVRIEAALQALGAESHGHQAGSARVYGLWATLGSHLLMLNRLRPDGGSRVPRAVLAFRTALDWALSNGHVSAATSLLNNLGALMLDIGQPLQALESLQQAIDLLASNPDVQQQHSSLLFNCGKALAAAGRLKEAQQAYTAAAVVAYSRDFGSFAKSAAAIEVQACGMLDKVLETLHMLGHDLGEGAAATCAPRRPILLQHLRPLPQCAAIWLGRPLMEHKLFERTTSLDEAPALFDAARKVLEQQQQQQQQDDYAASMHAQDHMHVAAGCQPSSIPVHNDGMCYTGCGLVHETDRLQARQQCVPTSWLTDPKPRPEEIAWLCFAAYKGLDQSRQYARAWAALQLANTLQSSVAPYDASTDVQNLQTIKAVFQRLLPPAGAGYTTSAAPIFIVGLPRSGSTLLESLLASHTDVVAGGEDTAFAPLSANITHVLANVQTAQQQMAIGSVTQQYLDWILDQGLQQLTHIGKEYVARMCAAHVPLGRECADTRVVDKMLRNLWLVGHINLVLPHACIVHVARHPLDAGLSCYAQPFLSPAMSWSWDLAHIALHINMTWQLADHWQATLPGRVHQLLYEEMMAAPEPALRRVLKACGLPWQPQLLTSFHMQERPVSTASLTQVRKPLYRSSMGRWRHYASQLAPLRKALGGTVQQYEARLAAALASYSAEELQSGT